eukprot:g4416.t1
MTAEKKELAEEAFFSCLELLDEVAALKAELAEACRGGRVELARAQFAVSRGKGTAKAAMSSFHYPAEIAPSLVVDTASWTVEAPKQDEGNGESKAQVADQKGGLRRRKDNKKGKKPEEEEEEAEGKKKDVEEPRQVADPIRWFSELPRPEMKKCQTTHKDVVRLAVRLASAQQRLLAAQKEYSAVR